VREREVESDMASERDADDVACSIPRLSRSAAASAA